MIEPLVAAAVKSLLQHCTSTGRAVAIKAAFDPMGKQVRPAFPRDFFTPHVREWKGKGKALDDRGIECRQCTQWPLKEEDGCCALKHSLWCPKRNRLFMLNEIIPQRSRPSSVGPSLHSSRRHLSSLHARQQSSLLRPRHTPVTTPTSPAPSIEEPHVPPDTIDKLYAYLSGTKPINPDEAWKRYISIPLHARRLMRPQEVLWFSYKLLSAVEPGYRGGLDTESLQEWGSRIEHVLQELEPNFTGATRVSQLCLLARAQALSGDLPKAISTAHEVLATTLADLEKEWLLDAYQNIILSINMRHSPVHVLDFLLDEWTFVGEYMQRREPLRNTFKVVAGKSESFRHTAQSLLVNIVNPAALLSERWTTPAKNRQRIGNMLLDIYCANDLPDDAYALFEEMGRQRLPANRHRQLQLVRVLVRAESFTRANTLFAAICSNDPSDTSFFRILTGLYLFAHQGDTVRAEEYYNLLHQYYSTYPRGMALLMHAYAVNGRVEKVVQLFHKFFPVDAPNEVRPNIVHYTTVLYAHAQRADLDGLNLWLETMSKAGIASDAHIFNIVLKSFVMRGEVDSVAAVLNQMRNAQIWPSHVLYTTAITLLARQNNPIAAEALYKRALREGVSPDRKMVTTLMNAHVEAGSWHGVIRVFDYLKSSSSRHIGLSIEVYNTLLKAYLLIGAPFRVVADLFRRLERSGIRPDVASYTVLIQSACDAGFMDTASEIFEEMEEIAKSSENGLRIDAFVLTIIMAGHLRVGDKVSAKAVYDSMEQRGIHPTSLTFGNILRAYGNEKSEESLQIAEEFLKGIMAVKPSERLWMTPYTRQSALEHVYRPLMVVYARKQNPSDVGRLLQGMIDAGGEPSLGTLTILLDAYRRTFDIQSVHEVWPQIWQLALRFTKVDSLFDGDNTDSTDPIKCQANVLCIPLSIYIDALSAAGEHLSIPEVWAKARSHGFSFDSHNWNHLVVALVRAGEPERAFDVVERVILPYQQQSQFMRLERDISPDSPLTFDSEPPSIDDPASEAPMHKADRRAGQVALSTLKAGSRLNFPEEVDDFAHPLHILHQISPSWQIWSPHATTLDVLAKVLLHLQAGRPVQAIGMERDTQLLGGDDFGSDEELERVETAKATLNRIYTNSPNTVQAVLRHERLEMRQDARKALPDGWS
ncbi:hypothetical protein BJ138DRAFT_1053038 [Hygrophoropsis aurantiaca]|uniref:Uncharacterized protein n=1 Tax=Hygrophoropsis aurantiaca TaxID=72124 RepID=A0ACB8ATH0_9AGAM|nr:hypothetical protein BJ138DRAFT_1053038 [Hygrophoropsis aurantiaca]